MTPELLLFKKEAQSHMNWEVCSSWESVTVFFSEETRPGVLFLEHSEKT